MNKKIYFVLLLSVFVYSCSDFSFVYNTKNIISYNQLKNKTSVSVTGDDVEEIHAYVFQKIRDPKDDPKYNLLISSRKQIEAIVIEKDATASKFSISYDIDYTLNSTKNSCVSLTKTISTKTTYNTKSAGYSFGSDLSKLDAAKKILRSNIDQFFVHLNFNSDSLSCNNEG
tara:strand:+ start:610 stop:1122 length:513 start_codon:yes stop_codon:yes gene_type:complete